MDKYDFVLQQSGRSDREFNLEDKFEQYQQMAAQEKLRNANGEDLHIIEELESKIVK